MSAAASKSDAHVRASAPPPPAAPPEPEPLTTPERFEHVPVDRIDPSPTNFRKAFDEAALEELSQSILIKGVVEPIIVRPKLSPVARNKREQAFVDGLGLDDARYELVAGERRWRATKLAGLETIPAVVRAYSDRAALEVQIIENDQRADVSPMERARGFRMMLDRLGYSADEIARKLHKSKTFVYSHLKLAKLPAVAAESLDLGPDAGGISRSVAELIARIPDEKARAKAADEIVRGYGNSGPMTFRDARAYVERAFMKELKGAPFKLDDAELLPAAGPCTACPHLSANTPEQYQGKRTDMCLLPSCFAQKVEAHHTRALDKFRAEGHAIVPAAEAKEMFRHSDSYISGSSKYEIITNTCYEDPRKRSYKQILGKDYKSAAAQTPRGAVVELCLKADVRKVLDADRPKGGAKSAKGGSQHPAAARKPDPERELMDAAMNEAAAKLVERAEANGNTMPLPLLRFLVTQHVGISSELERVAARRGVKCTRYNEDKAFAPLVASMSFRQLVGLLAEMCFFEPYVHGTEPDDDQLGLLKLFKLDFEKIKAAVKDRRDAEANNAKAAAPKAAAKPAAKKAARAAAGRRS